MYPDLGEQEAKTGHCVISVAAEVLAERNRVSGEPCVFWKQ